MAVEIYNIGSLNQFIEIKLVNQNKIKTKHVYFITGHRRRLILHVNHIHLASGPQRQTDLFSTAFFVVKEVWPYNVNVLKCLKYDLYLSPHQLTMVKIAE